jgi:hypothetical protein
VGSARGREHARLHRNNQDAAAFATSADVVIAAVADGCSSGCSTEVGARFAATWLARWLPRYARAGGVDAWAPVAAAALTAELGAIARALAPSPEDLPGTVNDFLLFSFLAAVVTRDRTTVIGAGDGMFAVNGSAQVIDPGPDNAPDYLAYALLDAEPRTRVRVHFDGATSDVTSIVVATDGASELIARPSDSGATSELAEIASDARYLKNPSLLQKRLTVLGEVRGALRDDTTAALVRRREAS